MRSGNRKNIYLFFFGLSKTLVAQISLKVEQTKYSRITITQIWQDNEICKIFRICWIPL